MTSTDVPGGTPPPLPPPERPSTLPASRVMSDRGPTREDLLNQEIMARGRAAMMKAMGITVAVVVAPFLALTFGLNAALGVLVVALLFTTIVTFGGARRADPSVRGRIVASAILNAVITVVVAILFVLRIALN